MGKPARQAVATGDSISLHSERFGDHELPADRVLSFPAGVIGFPDARRFALLDPPRPGSPFHHLVCLDEPELGFVVCDPTELWPDYAAQLPVDDVAANERALLVIVTVRDMTANLMAPLVVDRSSRTARQIVLDTGRFSTRHPVLAGAA
jgi:flagellar assembly factor FliW